MSLTRQRVEWTRGTEDAVGAHAAHLETDQVVLRVVKLQCKHYRPVRRSLYQVNGRRR